MEKETEISEAQEAQDEPEISAETKEIPVDIFSDKIPEKEVLPLDDKVKTKNYAAIPDQTQITEEPAPLPPSGANGIPTQQTEQKNTQQNQNQAEQTVDLILRGYEKLHALGRYIGKIDENELSQLHIKGEIDLEQQLPVGRKTVSVGAFFSEYNSSIDENISVSQDFKNNIKPPLTRICTKHNWLLSDELYVGSILAEDLSTKVSLLIGLKKSANLIVSACKEIKEKQNKSEKKEEKQHTQSEKTEQSMNINETWKEPEQPIIHT